MKTRVRTTAATATLIKQHETVGLPIEEPAMPGLTAGAWPAVHHDGRFAFGVAAYLPVDVITSGDFQHSLCIGNTRHDRYICSGAPIPSTSRPDASTRAVRALRTRREARTAGSEFSTGQAS